jgi:dCMP deaminase
MCEFCEDPSNFEDSTKAFKWHSRYFNVAKEVASWSKDPSTQVGAVAIGTNGQILAQGFNGFPRNMKDTKERLEDREEKYKRTIHAEMNVILNAAESGISLRGATLYVYGLWPCHLCTLSIIQSGIKTVVARKADLNKAERWIDSVQRSVDYFHECGVNFITI